MTGIDGVTPRQTPTQPDPAAPAAFSAVTAKGMGDKKSDGEVHKFNTISLHSPEIREKIKKKLPGVLADTPIKMSDYKDPKNATYKNDYATVYVRGGHVSVDVTKAGIAFLNNANKPPLGQGQMIFKGPDGKLGVTPPRDRT